jgi:threonine synthase
MDISKASNFERYVYDIVLRDPAVVRGLWTRIAEEGGFDLAGTPHWPRVAASGFVSGTSTHGDRIATIRDAYARCGAMLDPHTADGVCVGRRLRDPKVPLMCIETALPTKFATTIREALGRDPERPAAYADLESRPQRCDVLPADTARVKNYIAAHAKAAA